ncbi:MAG: hypothetical protein IM600_12000 [Bacteroidetes bacterium]|nr:hypothetical protein [Bacteroidota bacterium]
MPTFRVRQQETIVLKSFNFGEHMYPLIEIVKEFDRSRKDDTQKTFEEIHIELIEAIQSTFVFIDLPIYLKQSGAVKDEVVAFSYSISNNLEKRCEYLNKLSIHRSKAIPVISSFLSKTGDTNSIQNQFELLQPNFDRIAFRLFPLTFKDDFSIVSTLARPNDYIIMDLDTINPFPKSPPLRPLIAELKSFHTCCKILLRSAINTEIQNVKLDHGQVVYEADNSQIDIDILNEFGVNATGDFVGIKKDDLTAGGTISPGFIYYDATENQYYGYRAAVKELIQFENLIVPAIISSDATQRMLATNPPFVGAENPGYNTLLSISSGAESGKSQAKFKKIAMEHYLYCMRLKIENGELHQTNVQQP